MDKATTVNRQPTLTYDDVANVCDLMKQFGVKVTQTSVQSLLGRGSTTTINKHVNTWLEYSKKPSVSISPSLIRGIEAEIERHSHEITASLSDEKHRLEDEVQRLTASLTAEKAERIRLEKEQEKMEVAHKEEILHLTNLLEADRLEQRATMRTLESTIEELRKEVSLKEQEARDNIKAMSRTETIVEGLEQEKTVLSTRIETLQQEKEDALLENAANKAIVEELRAQMVKSAKKKS